MIFDDFPISFRHKFWDDFRGAFFMDFSVKWCQNGAPLRGGFCIIPLSFLGQKQNHGKNSICSVFWGPLGRFGSILLSFLRVVGAISSSFRCFVVSKSHPTDLDSPTSPGRAEVSTPRLQCIAFGFLWTSFRTHLCPLRENTGFIDHPL